MIMARGPQEPEVAWTSVKLEEGRTPLKIEGV